MALSRLLPLLRFHCFFYSKSRAIARELKYAELKYADMSRRNDEQSKLIGELRDVISKLRSEQMEPDSLPSPSKCISCLDGSNGYRE